jgi:hypothetical protein
MENLLGFDPGARRFAAPAARAVARAGRRIAGLCARQRLQDRRPLSSNLGTVELTVALHYVYNTPDDRLGLGRAATRPIPTKS